MQPCHCIFCVCMCAQSLPDLLKTLLDLCREHTTIIMSYEERTTGNKPQIEKQFFEVSVTLFYGLAVYREFAIWTCCVLVVYVLVRSES